MLRWRPNGHNIYMYTQRYSVAIVCSMHLCVGIALFCIGTSDTLLVVLDESALAARVVYNPLMKTAPQAVLKNKQSGHAPSTKNVTKKNEVTVKDKKNTQKTAKKNEPKPAQDLKGIQKKDVEKPKTASLQSSAQKKKNKKNKQDIKEPVKELQSKKDATIKTTEPVLEEYVIYIGRDDQEGIRVQTLIKEAVSQQWRSPSGFDMAWCIVEVLITKTGHVKDVTIQKNSGSPAYDIAARTAAANTRYPKEVWNKKLILQFGKGL